MMVPPEGPCSCSSSSFRMRLMVDFLQPVGCYMGINLSRRKTFVPQQLFHSFQVCTPVQQMRREGVPEHMRAFLLQFRYPGYVALHDATNDLGIHPFAVI